MRCKDERAEANSVLYCCWFLKYLLATVFIVILINEDNILENVKKCLQFIIEICYNIKNKKEGKNQT